MPGVAGELTRSARTRATAGLELVPFRAVLYDSGRVADLAGVTAPPYDMIDADTRAALELADPHNVVRLILPPEGAGGHAGRYSAAADRLADWRASGVLVTEPDAALYVYEQRSTGTLQRGVLGALGLRALDERVVLPHEDVLPAVVADRLELIRTTAANLEPILLQYEGDTAVPDVLDAAVQGTPLTEAHTSDGVRHRVWRLDDPGQVSKVQADLQTRQALIADGHHRYAAYLRLQAEQHAAGSGAGPWDHGLALLVDANRYPLHVHGIHRVVSSRPAEQLVAVARRHASVVDASARTVEANLTRLSEVTGPAFVLAADAHRQWLVSDVDGALIDRFVPRDRPEAWRRLDTAVLHHVLLEQLWQVPDDATAVSYHHTVEAALRHAERSGGSAILLRPVPVETVLDLARRGIRMPRKSTSFGPKPRSGLVLRVFDTE
jgi:uncharacterized protein (DUF1015 family)